MSRPVIAVHGLEQTHHAWWVFSKPWTKLTLHWSGHIWTPQNGAHRKPFPAATPSWKLAPRPRRKHEKRTAGSAWETWTVAATDGVRCARVRWEINFLLTFETAPFFCVYCVYFKRLTAIPAPSSPTFSLPTVGSFKLYRSYLNTSVEVFFVIWRRFTRGISSVKTLAWETPFLLLHVQKLSGTDIAR